MRFLYALGLILSSYLLPLNITPRELIVDLAKGNSVKQSTYKALHLFDLDPSFFEGLREEVHYIIENFPPSVVQNQQHVTNWTNPFGTALQFSLFNTSGKFQDFSTDHIKSVKNKKFHQSKEFPYLAELIESMPGLLNMRINVMGPKSGLSQHKEDIFFTHTVTKKPALRVRFHIPIETNPLVSMFLQGENYHFHEGGVFFFHNGCVHAAANNNAEESRTHLVFDLLLTEKTFKQMFTQETNVHFLQPVQNQKIKPYSLTPINPNYKIQRKTTPFSVAKTANLCPTQ